MTPTRLQHFKGVMFLCIGFAAWHVLPYAYGATVPVSVRLCKSKDPFMQVGCRYRVVLMPPPLPPLSLPPLGFFLDGQGCCACYAMLYCSGVGCLG